MKNWLTFLVLMSFIRLQFVCCCGPIDHGHMESQPCTSAIACSALVENKCPCDHHTNTEFSKTATARSEASARIESQSMCECQICNQDHSHQPHLFAAEHLKIASSPSLSFESLVAQSSLPVEVASSDLRCSPRVWVSEKCLHNGISILCEFGRLRI